MKSNLEWKKWGEKDPLFAVATWKGKERGAANAWTDAEFYDLGRSDWTDFKRHWTDYGLSTGAAVEIGCGAGRITNQLGQYFQTVSALDVSPHQLEYARNHVTKESVKFILTDGLLVPLESNSHEGVFSVHVFQHFESHPDAMVVFKEIHRVLKPGATFMIHLPLYQLPDTKISVLLKPIIALGVCLSNFKAALDRKQLLKGKWKFIMRRLRFEQQPLMGELEAMGFEKVEFKTFKVVSNGSIHDFVFATKM